MKKTKVKNKWQNNSLTNKINIKTYIYIAICCTFIARIILSLLPAYTIDISGYYAWSKELALNGATDIYQKFKIVYAPLYLYLLLITGKIASVINLSLTNHYVLIKFWSVLFEFIGAYYIYKISKKYDKERIGIFVSFFYVLNPGVYINSSIWGQFDSIPATLLIIMIYLFDIKKKNQAVFIFLLAVLTKPQSGLLAPLAIFLYLKDFKFSRKKDIKQLLLTLFGGIITYLLIVTPFYTPTKLVNTKSPVILKFFDNFYWLYNLYETSLQDYPYATANAFNFWTLFNGQINNDINPIWGLNYLKWGIILFSLCFIICALFIVFSKNKAFSYYYCAFMVFFSAFMFITKMHERYLLPAIIFITVACIFDKKLYIPLLLTSFCVFSNHYYVYKKSFDKIYWLKPDDNIAFILALITLLTFIGCMFYGVYKFIYKKGE